MPRPARIVAVAFVLLGIAALITVLGAWDDPAKVPDWHAFVLGIVQGMTELLPISSSGHLILVPWLAEWTYLEQHDEFNQTFDVALHLGTLVAVIVVFARDLVDLLVAWLRSVRRRRVETQTERLAWVVAAATVPAALLGFLFADSIATHLGEPWQIAILLAGFALLLWWADRTPQTYDLDHVGFRRGLVVGIAQSLALMPGVSRSGVTITAARFLGLDRDAAARLSFILLVPVVLGAVVFKGITDVLLGELPEGWVGPFLVGTLAAAGSGLLAIQWLLGYVRKHSYGIFVVYRLVVAAVILLLIASGVREAEF